jgi:hypothetical protein
MREVHWYRMQLPTQEHVLPCLDKGTLITRDRYTAVPMPEHVVRIIQQMATTMKTVNLEDEHLPCGYFGHTLASAPVDPANNLDYGLSRMKPI